LRSSAIAFSSACGFTPASASALAASVPLASSSAISMRSTVTNGIARLLGNAFGLVEDPRRLGRHVDLTRALALDLGLLGQRRLDRAVHGAGIAACGVIRLAARPSGSSSRTFKRWSGRNR
jgi:hypothetical protein